MSQLIAYWGTREKPGYKFSTPQTRRSFRKVVNAVFDAADAAKKLAKTSNRKVSLFIPFPTEDEKQIDRIAIHFGEHYGPQMTLLWEAGGKDGGYAV